MQTSNRRREQLRSLEAQLRPHPPKPPLASNSRAGRNLPAAIGTAVVLLGVLALSLAFRIEIFVALAVAFLAIGLWEFAGAVLARNIHVPLLPLLAGQVVMMVLAWTHGLESALLAYLATVVATHSLVRVRGSKDLIPATIGSFGLAWIGLAGSFAVALAALPKGASLVTALVLLPVANDTGGWLAGILFGKHPIAPKISPKKSWEGFVGSLLLALLGSFLVVGLLVGMSWPWVVLFGLVTPILATAGDFSESMIKRDLGIKDMGTIFPGHGGMLDRLDSILFTAPVFYLLFTLGLGLF